MMKRKIFVCAHCQCIYADAPVTECDCQPGANEFIEGTAEYYLPVMDTEAEIRSNPEWLSGE